MKVKQIKSKQIKSKQLKSKQTNSKQIKSKQIKSKQIKSKQIKSKQIKSKQRKSKEIKSKQLKSLLRCRSVTCFVLLRGGNKGGRGPVDSQERFLNTDSPSLPFTSILYKKHFPSGVYFGSQQNTGPPLKR